MSATLSRAVHRLPSPTRLVFSPPSRSAIFTSRQPICLATYGFQCRVQPFRRGYASQSDNNNNNKDDKEIKGEDGDKKVEENKDESSKPPPGVENSGFRHFFSTPRSEREKNQFKNEEDRKVENKAKEKEAAEEKKKDDGKLEDPKPPQGVE